MQFHQVSLLEGAGGANMQYNIGESPKLDLKLNLSPPPASPSPARVDGQVASPKGAREISTEGMSMMLVGCPRCLMYVMLFDEDPKCPKCKTTVLLDFLHHS